MAAIQELSAQCHAGETAVRRLLNGPQYNSRNPSASGLSQAHAYRVAISPLVAFGALDRQGRPWTTVLGGSPQFTAPVAPNVLGVQSIVDLDYDPVIDALFGCAQGDGKKGDGELLRPGPDNGPIMAGLSIDLMTRDRVKLAGKMIAGAASARPEDPAGDTAANAGRVGEAQIAFLVQETLGNCPKYLNKKRISNHIPRPQLVHDSDTMAGPLPQAGLDLIRQADLFFLSSTDGKTMDTNHRGGAPGFLRIASEGGIKPGAGQSSPLTLVYPEFSGNRLYQTLGNLHVRPLVGLVIPDFNTGNVLYCTGHTKLLIGSEAGAYLPHTKLAVRIVVDRTIFVADGLPFRGEVVDYSPYNPPVRRLLSEMAAAGGDPSVADASERKDPIAMAVLTGRQELSPTVSRFTFTLEPSRNANPSLPQWQAGQYITLDFSSELDIGWSHMRDDDPLSLNDDFIRTFTISSPPPVLSQEGASKPPPSPATVELTLRRHGPVTNLLWRHNPRVPLEIPVLSFGGDDAFRIPLPLVSSAETVPRESIFVAAGVGITPLLAQAPGVLSNEKGKENIPLRVLWSLRVADIPVAVDSFKRIQGLARHTTVFITDDSGAEGLTEPARQLRLMGCTVFVGRRIRKTDIVPGANNYHTVARGRIYICTGSKMLADLQHWLEGRIWYGRALPSEPGVILSGKWKMHEWESALLSPCFCLRGGLLKNY